MRPWLKAGLIGGAVLGVLTILQSLGTFFPQASSVISCCTCILYLLAYPGVGVLAAYWLTPPRTAGEGAKEGALAGVIAGAVDAAVTFIMALITGAAGAQQAQQALQQMPPEVLQGLEEMGLKGLFSPAGFAAMSCVGGICGLLWAVAMGAVGGAILAAVKRE